MEQPYGKIGLHVKRNPWRSLLAAIVVAMVGIFFSVPAAAADFTAEIRPQPVIVGEPAQLVMTSSAAYPEPEAMPRVDGIEWLEGASRSSQTSIINFKASQTYVVAYPFRATKEGKFTIPAFPVNLKSAKALTQPLTVQVVKRQFNVANADGKGKRAVDLEDLLYMRVRYLDDRTEFFVGEEIPIQVQVYTINGLMVEFPYPEMTMTEGGAEVIFRDCTSVNNYSRIFTSYEQANQKVGGDAFGIQSCRAWLRPVSPGKLGGTVHLTATISIPAQQNRRRGGDPFFDSFFQDPFNRYQQHPYELTADLPTATVKALPPPPGGADALGLVGDWQVAVDVSPATARVGEPLTLRIKVSGRGTTETLVAPKLDLPGCRLFPPEINRPPRGMAEQDQAEIRYAVIPLQAGPLPLSLRLATFAPDSGKYRETEWKKTLTVTPGEATATVVVDTPEPEEGTAPSARPTRERANGLLYLKRNPGTGVLLPLWRNSQWWLALLLLLGPLAWGGAEWLTWHRHRFANDPALRRQQAARGRRNHVLRRLRRAEPENIAAIIREDVVPYLNDRLALPPGMTASELANKVDDPELATCLRDAETGAYLPGATSPAELREALLRALTRLGIAIFAFGLILLSTTTQAEVTDNPFAAYDDGHFAEAAAAFSARLNPARPDPVLLYNLGNCRYQQGDLTGALVCFEQARRLAPRDSDIRENLNHVRRRLMLPEVGRGNNPLTLAADLRDHFRPDEWLLLAAAAWAAAGLFLALRRRLPTHGLLTALAATGLVAVVALAAAASQRNQTYSPETAVILQRGAPVRVLPSETAREAEYRLYPGEPVRIVETRDDGWRRIRGEGGEGWIRADAVAPLWHPDRLELPTEKTP